MPYSLCYDSEFVTKFSTKINTDLERMGDQTLNTVRYGLEFFTSETKERVPADLKKMFDEVIEMVRMGLDAFSSPLVER